MTDFERIERMTEDEMFRVIEDLERDCKSKPEMSGHQYLSQLNDFELGVYITARTYSFGRSFEAAKRNALCHLEKRDRAVRMFSREKTDFLGLVPTQ